MTFLSDQGRDAIIVKRIVTFEHWPAIGAPTSVGHIFLGPFYYYLIAPFLFFSRLDPVGMAVGMAVISLIGLLLCYLIVLKEFGRAVANTFLGLAVFSAVLVEYSRFSWNPNPLPYFAFIALYTWHRALINHSMKWAILSGSVFALALQLHYLANLLAPTMIIMYLFTLLRSKKRKKHLLTLLCYLLGVVVFSSPLILFDLKHGFLNSKSFLALFSKTEVSSGGISMSRIIETLEAFVSPAINLKVDEKFVYFTIFSLVGICIYILKSKKHKLIATHAGTILLYCIGFSYLVSFRHPHYYMTIYLSLYLVLSYVLVQLSRNKYQVIVITAILLVFAYINSSRYFFLKNEPNNQAAHAKRLALFLKYKIGGQPFNVATWPIAFSEEPYLYFLEVEGIRPANRELSEITSQMYVLCNEEPCSIINSPSWNINMFGPAKIAYKWNIEGINIYKLVHEN